MSEEEYSEILDGSVEEVKEAIREKENLDLKKLREMEEEGKDRKTVKEFIDERIEDEVEEIVEDVKEEERTSLAFGAGGVVVGLVLGLLIGAFALGPTGEVSPEQIQQDVEDYWQMELEGVDFEGDSTVTEPEMQHGMYYTTVELNGTFEGQEIEETQGFYVTTDGELLFTEVRQLGMVVEPTQLQEVLSQDEEQEIEIPDDETTDEEGETEEVPEDQTEDEDEESDEDEETEEEDEETEENQTEETEGEDY